MEEKELLEMRLHDLKDVNKNIEVLKVPGGLIYMIWNNYTGHLTSCFVPEPPTVLADFPEADHIVDANKKVRDDINVGATIEVRDVINGMDATVRNYQSVEEEKMILEIVNFLEAFDLSEPDEEGNLWLSLKSTRSTGQALFNIGNKDLLAVQTMRFFEEYRKSALHLAKTLINEEVTA